MKRLLFSFLFVLTAIAGWAQTTFTQGDFTYTVTDEDAKTVSIAKAEAATLTGALVIPSSVVYETVTYTVTSVGASGFYGTGITGVTFPASVTSIGNEAFRYSGLTSITIPASVMTIGDAAFQSCGSLASITIEDSETPLTMSGAWYERPFIENSATTFYIGRNLTLTGEGVNPLAYNATSVEFGPKVTTINPALFYTNTKLASIIIGNGVTTIGESAFLACGQSDEVTETVVTMGSNVTSIGTNAFKDCTHIKSVTLPSKLTTIGSEAFRNTGLTSISIPASVTNIGDAAFQDCGSMASITIEDSNTPLTMPGSWYERSFWNGATTIYIGRDLTLDGGENNPLLYEATSVEFGPKVTTINPALFYTNTKLASLTIGSGVTTIGESAFNGCGTYWNEETNQGVEELVVTMGNNVTSIGANAFQNCSKLKSITLSSKLTTIGSEAFRNTGLTSISIPASVTNIGDAAFQNCGSMASITIEDSETPLTMPGTWYERPFDNGASTIYIGRNLTLTGDDVSYPLLDYATSVEFGPQMTAIPNYLFSGAELSSVKVPWLTPIAINENVFASGAYSSATLFVPAGTKEAYAAASIWKNFTNIDHWSTLVTLTASTHGSIVTAEATASNGTEQYRQPKNDAIIYTLNADTGYELTALTDNAAAVSPLPTLGEEQTRANTEGEEFVTLNASFTPITYTLTYTLNGGTATNPATYTIETENFTLNNPTKAGYDFAGWKLNGEGDAMMTVTITQGSTGNLAYTATWTPTVYNIVYTMDGGTATPANPTTYTIETATFTLTNPTKTGYDFAGWKLNGEGDAMMEVTIAQGSTGNLAYTATWTPITYNIVYTMDGGTATPDNPTTYTIETETFTLNNPTKTGYDFAGWKLNGEGDAMMEVTIAQGSTGNLAYTATWIPTVYNIVYTMDGGTATPDNPTTYTIETETFTLNNPTKTGYTFKGWKLNGEGDAQMTVTISTGSTGDKAYTATWQVNQYTITFDSNGGSAVDAITQDYGTAITSPDDPTRTGYDFAGWSPAVPATMPAENMTVVAQWTKATYTVTITGGGVTADNTTPEYGDNVVLTIMDDPDAELISLTVNGDDVTSSIVENHYTISGVTGNVSVVATWNSTKEFITLGSDIATFSCTQDLNFTGSELKAYIAAGFSKDGGTVLLVRVYDVPANTGLVIKGTQGDTYKIPYSTSMSYFVNMLKAHTTADAVPVTEGDYTNFILQRNGEDYVWNHDTEGTMLLGAKKAYLQLPTSFVSGNSARQMSMIFEDELTPTEIRDNYILLQESKYNGRIYNLNGQQIETLQKGVNIVNGRKILK